MTDRQTDRLTDRQRVDLLSSAVPACPADAVGRHIRPVDVVRLTVEVHRHYALQPNQWNHDIRHVFCVQRDTTNVQLACKQDETAQIYAHFTPYSHAPVPLGLLQFHWDYW